MKRVLDRAPGRPVPDHLQHPLQIQQARKRIPKELVGCELVAVAHHRDGDETWRLSFHARWSCVGPDIDEGLEWHPTPRVSQQRQHAFPIDWVEPYHGVGPPDRALCRLPTSRPTARRLFWRVGSLGDDIGNAQRVCDWRSQPIRRLMVKMIGKPEFRSGFWSRAPAADKMGRKAAADGRQPSLTPLVAMPVIAAKSRCYERIVASQPQRLKEQLRDPAVSRGNWVIRRFQWSIE